MVAARGCRVRCGEDGQLKREIAVLVGTPVADLMVENARLLLLAREHHTSGHVASVPGCPVCYNGEIADARIAAGELLVQFEHEGPLSPNSVERVRRR